MNYHIFLSSNLDKEYYPQNTPSVFRNRISSNIRLLSERMYVTPLEIYTTVETNRDYIHLRGTKSALVEGFFDSVIQSTYGEVDTVVNKQFKHLKSSVIIPTNLDFWEVRLTDFDGGIKHEHNSQEYTFLHIRVSIMAAPPLQYLYFNLKNTSSLRLPFNLDIPLDGQIALTDLTHGRLSNIYHPFNKIIVVLPPHKSESEKWGILNNNIIGIDSDSGLSTIKLDIEVITIPPKYYTISELILYINNRLKKYKIKFRKNSNGAISISNTKGCTIPILKMPIRLSNIFGWTVDKNNNMWTVDNIQNFNIPIHRGLTVHLGKANEKVTIPKSIGVIINLASDKSSIASQDLPLIRVLHERFGTSEKDNFNYEFENPQFFHACPGYFTKVDLNLIDIDTSCEIDISDKNIAGCLALSF